MAGRPAITRSVDAEHGWNLDEKGWLFCEDDEVFIVPLY